MAEAADADGDGVDHGFLSHLLVSVSGGESALSGYLYKKTRDGRWQRRWFETNGFYLTYYKVSPTPFSKSILFYCSVSLAKWRNCWQP